MSDFARLLLSIDLPIALIILGSFLSAALVFEEYFGVKPRKEVRNITGLIGVLFVASGVVVLLLPSSIEPQSTVKDHSTESGLVSSENLVSDAPVSNTVSIKEDPRPKVAGASETEDSSRKGLPDLTLFWVYIQYYPSNTEDALKIKNILAANGFKEIRESQIREGRLAPRVSEIIYYGPESQAGATVVLDLLSKYLNFKFPLVKSEYYGTDGIAKYKIMINVL